MTELNGSAGGHRDLPSLTGLRVVAAVAVFVNHLGYFLGETSIAGPWTAIRPVGVTGLLLFFVLSGYLLGAPGALRGGGWAFAVRRIARIHPVYLFALGVSVLLLLVHGGPGRHLVVPGTLLANVLLVQSWSPAGEAVSISLPAWSLSVEVLFYAALPFTLSPFVRQCRARPRATLVVLTGCTLLGGQALIAGWVWPTFPPAYLPVFYLGTYGAVIGAQGLRSVPAAAGLAVASVVGFLCWPNPVLPGLAFLVLVTTLAAHDRRGRPVLGGVWRRAGSWSMPFFLLHLVVLDVVILFFPTPSRTVAGGLALAALVFALSTVVAALTHRCVEEPGRRLVLRAAARRRRGRLADA